MADEALRCARRVTDIGLKTGLRAHLKTGTLWYKGTRRVSSSPVWFLLRNARNTSGTGAGSVWESYTRVKPVVSTLDIAYQRALDNKWSSISIRAYSGNGGFQEPLYRSKTGYYDILGVLPNATHVQIKTAYYKQSFAYHPDRNAGSEEATLRFSEINEAYTVLGNKALRKKYDRGLLSSSDLTASVRASPKDTATASSKQRTNPRRSVLDPEGSSRVFDFDKFYRSHYGEQLQRDRDTRERRMEMLRNKEKSMADQSMDSMMGLGVGLLLTMALVILLSLK